MKVQIAKDPESILKCFEVMHVLRPHLKKETFVKLMEDMMSRGYNLIFIEENSKAVCASGYRYSEHLAWGKPIYIDDLSTLPEARGKGYANILLDHIIQQAKEKGYDQIHLDSGCTESRYDAHRLYLKKGFNITSHHFALKLY
jgi:GNAT superfamily N-acetyltransferase